MKILERVNTVATGLLATCALSVFFTLLFVLLIEKPYLSYPKLPFLVTNTNLKPGDLILMEITRCNSDLVDHSYTVARAMREIHTGLLIPMDSVYSLVPSGCHSALPSRVHRVPLETPPGTYEFFGGAIIHGTVRTWDVTFKSKPFVVVEEDKK